MSASDGWEAVCLKELREEVKHFRIQLPPNIRRRACALADPVSAHDGEAERELRAIACEYKWLFHDLCEDLGRESSGGPEFFLGHSSSRAPIVDEQLVLLSQEFFEDSRVATRW